MRKFAAAIVLAAGLAGQASAQSSAPMVGAHAPESVVSALRNAGYRAELGTDGNGDPMITSTFASMVSFIHFYGCNEGKDCTSLMFTTGFDSEKPWKPEDALAINRNIRFASTWLDDEGDPWISWDVATGLEGIPTGAFVYGLRKYETTVAQVADQVFGEEATE